MINLLPAEEKQKLILEIKKRLVINWGIIVLVFLVCLILVLFSIKFYILSEADYQTGALQQAQKENQTQEFITTNETIQSYNKILTQLDSFYKKEIYFNQVLKIISEVQSPKDLRLASFALNRDNDGGGVRVTVFGVSGTRDSLLIFRQNVEGRQEIKNPYFSPESWISPDNVNFSLTFEVSQNEKQQ